MDKINKGMDRLTLVVSGIGLAGLMLLITAGVISRAFFNFSIPAAYEIVEVYLMPLTIFVALGYSYKSGIFPRIDNFVENLQSPKLRQVINAIIVLIELLIFAFVTYYMFDYAVYSIETGMGVRASGITFPLYPIYLLTSLGFLWLTICIIQRFIKVFKKGREEDS